MSYASALHPAALPCGARFPSSVRLPAGHLYPRARKCCRVEIAPPERSWRVPAGVARPGRIGGRAPAGHPRGRPRHRSQPRDFIGAGIGIRCDRVDALARSPETPAGAAFSQATELDFKSSSRARCNGSDLRHERVHVGPEVRRVARLRLSRAKSRSLLHLGPGLGSCAAGNFQLAQKVDPGLPSGPEKDGYRGLTSIGTGPAKVELRAGCRHRVR
jgi:hypothetical protein